MLTIDGSYGEGGGQILRSSLALSMLTRTPIRIENIRANRRKPGLKRQHLAAVRAAAAVSAAEVVGDEIESRELTFSPAEIRGGDYTFRIGTAGSTTLVLQTVLPALVLADRPSRIVLEGGTHNPMAPPFDFLAKAFLPLLRRMGPRVDVELERPGFFPAGGGRFTARIEPVDKLEAIDLHTRGKTIRRAARAVVANLPRQIAERELRAIQKKLSWRSQELHVEETTADSPGNIVLLEVESEEVCEVFTSIGEVRRSAESVANAAARDCRRYLEREEPVGEYLTDQLILPLALARTGSFLSTGLSSHATTHIDLVRRFLDVRVETERRGDGVLVEMS